MYKNMDMSNLKGKIVRDVDTSVSHSLKITFTDGTEVIVVTEDSDASVVWEGPNQ